MNSFEEHLATTLLEARGDKYRDIFGKKIAAVEGGKEFKIKIPKRGSNTARYFASRLLDFRKRRQAEKDAIRRGDTNHE
jgi:hypothetical protein